MARLPFLLAFALMLICGGCRGGHGTAPSAEVAQDAGTPSAEPRAILGAYYGVLDTTTLALTAMPDRAASAISGSTDTLEVAEITQFFNTANCPDCLEPRAVYRNPDGTIGIDVAIKHPYPNTPGGPRHLTVFNVEGVFIIDDETMGADATLQSFETPDVLSVVTSPRITNASGYTWDLADRFRNGRVSSFADLHPYRLFFDDYSQGTFDSTDDRGVSDLDNIYGMLAMGQGQGPDVKSYIIEAAPGMQVPFWIVVVASYGHAANGEAEWATPTYRVPQFNKKAASEVHVSRKGATPRLIAGDSGSSDTYRVEILDINEQSTGATVGPDPNQLAAASDIDRVNFYWQMPTISASQSQTRGQRLGGRGDDPGGPLEFEFTLRNDDALSAGTWFGLIEVSDTYLAGNSTFPDSAAVEGPTPGSLAFVDPLITGRRAYALFPIDIAPSTGTPTACLTRPPGPFAPGGMITLDATCSTDPDSLPLVFEWDMDFDGLFDEPNDDTYEGPSSAPVVSFLEAGTYSIGLIVRRQSGETDRLPNGPINQIVVAGPAINPVFQQGPSDSDRYGASVAYYEDTGRGINFLAVGDPAWDAPTADDAGRVYLYTPGPQGLGNPTVIDNPAGAYADGRFGAALAWATADVGILAIGAPGNPYSWFPDDGRAYVMVPGVTELQSVNGISGGPDSDFGAALAGGGLANGKGLLLIGAPRSGNVGDDAGGAYCAVLTGFGWYPHGLSSLRPDLDIPGQEFGYSLSLGQFAGGDPNAIDALVGAVDTAYAFRGTVNAEGGIDFNEVKVFPGFGGFGKAVYLQDYTGDGSDDPIIGARHQNYIDFYDGDIAGGFPIIDTAMQFDHFGATLTGGINGTTPYLAVAAPTISNGPGTVFIFHPTSSGLGDFTTFTGPGGPSTFGDALSDAHGFFPNGDHGLAIGDPFNNSLYIYRLGPP